MYKPLIPPKPRNSINSQSYSRISVGCLILSKDNKIILQERDWSASTFPGCLGTFGGGLEQNEKPIQALVRELKEELGAEVKPRDVINFGAFTEAVTNHNQLVYLYFWHDKFGTITGCYEGTAKYYKHTWEAEKHPKIMDDVRWLLNECQQRKLILF